MEKTQIFNKVSNYPPLKFSSMAKNNTYTSESHNLNEKKFKGITKYYITNFLILMNSISRTI